MCYVNNNLSNKFAAKDISDGSLNQITTTGFYFGSNITEVTPYIKSHMWCLINAYVSGNSASIFVIAGNAMALSIYRNVDGIYSYYPIATKSDLKTTIIEKQFKDTIAVPSGTAYSLSTFKIPYTVPSGYNVLAICRAWVDDRSSNVKNAYLSGTESERTTTVEVSNLNGVEKNAVAYVNILFIKS